VAAVVVLDRLLRQLRLAAAAPVVLPIPLQGQTELRIPVVAAVEVLMGQQPGLLAVKELLFCATPAHLQPQQPQETQPLPQAAGIPFMFLTTMAQSLGHEVTNGLLC
jgi:hypothetical protein